MPPAAPGDLTLPGTQPDPRRLLRWETWLVMLAFLLPVVATAVLLFAQHLAGVGGVTRFPDIVHNNVANLILGIFEYLPVMAVVPLALFLLARTGDTPSTLGLGLPGLVSDVLPGIGLAVGSFCTEILILIPLAPLVAHHSKLLSSVPVGHVPGYYVVWGVAISAVTAITEEVLMNGYLITRLQQLGWTSGGITTLAVVLRTSYHVYYGIGFLLTIPFSIYATRSFQKHRRLTRPIVAHFLFDAVLISIAILR